MTVSVIYVRNAHNHLIWNQPIKSKQLQEPFLIGQILYYSRLQQLNRAIEARARAF